MVVLEKEVCGLSDIPGTLAFRQVKRSSHSFSGIWDDLLCDSTLLSSMPLMDVLARLRGSVAATGKYKTRYYQKGVVGNEDVLNIHASLPCFARR